MNKQDTFDKVVKHARTQNEKAQDLVRKQCLYRTESGLKCFIGCLIPDNLYNKGMESKTIIALHNHHNEVMEEIFGSELTKADIDFLSNLQRIHDQSEVRVWESKFKHLAETEGLVYNQVNFIENN